ncbi:signal peptide peptidase SppA [Virgibacillus alimentarius]|uniref:Protease-4 n=1 Tax=Virgibacillus alimentarius TaxID=698769 RepID=A0ABS4SAP9_9BACI|nr:MULTISPECIES: signal peptide peptidase SppA [Virgibacillus]MBP2258582.1 protease-4 [Virgibacillus alimentarius]HLR68426.1 signal peptide peptidase SppA [Virgibacillus sp.]
MDGKRWLALGIAAGLFVISIVVQLSTTAATTDFQDLFSEDEVAFKETVIDKGKQGTRNKIAVLNLEGVIQDTGSHSMFNSPGYDHKRFLKMVDEAGKDRSVDGIILRINSPGGGVVESAEIHEKVTKIQEETEKPVYVSMGNTAASGGYYVAAPADKIVANPATLTGSIGVIMESINFAELADEYGIDFNTIKSGEYKDIMSSSRKMKDEEKEILQTMIDELYDEFVQVIVDGRGMPESKVRKLGDGRVYTGKQAKENNLVDELGTLEDTVALMEEDHDLKGASVIEYETSYNFKQLIGASAQSMFKSDGRLSGIMDQIRNSDGPRAMYLYSK